MYCCLIFTLLLHNLCSVHTPSLTGGMGIRDCAKKECQEEASVDEDPLGKNLHVLLPHLYYSVIL